MRCCVPCFRQRQLVSPFESQSIILRQNYGRKRSTSQPHARTSLQVFRSIKRSIQIQLLGYIMCYRVSLFSAFVWWYIGPHQCRISHVDVPAEKASDDFETTVFVKYCGLIWRYPKCSWQDILFELERFWNLLWKWKQTQYFIVSCKL